VDLEPHGRDVLAHCANTVTVHKPIKAKAPRISNPGTDNQVTRPK
jgi:hypothetical protein